MADIEDGLNNASAKGLKSLGKEAIQKNSPILVGPEAGTLAKQSDEAFFRGDIAEAGEKAVQSLGAANRYNIERLKEVSKWGFEKTAGYAPLDYWKDAFSDLIHGNFQNAGNNLYKGWKVMHITEMKTVSDIGGPITMEAVKAGAEFTSNAQTFFKIAAGNYSRLNQETEPEIKVNPGNGEMLGPPAPPQPAAIKAAPENNQEKPHKNVGKQPGNSGKGKNGEKHEKPAIKEQNEVRPDSLKITGGQEAPDAHEAKPLNTPNINRGAEITTGAAKGGKQ